MAPPVGSPGRDIQIVVLGASCAGIPLAHSFLRRLSPALRPKVKVILVDPSTHFYYSLASPRAFASPSAMPQEKLFYNTAKGFAYAKDAFEFVEGTAIEVKDKACQVIVKMNRENVTRAINFSYLVIATGSKGQKDDEPWKALTSLAETKASLLKKQRQLQVAKTVAIIGGGPTGVEAAGELATLLLQKPHVMLFHAGAHLLPQVPERIGHIAQTELEKLGVEVVLGGRVYEDGTNLTTRDGRVWRADVVLHCAGLRPNTTFLPRTWLDGNGWLIADQTLRVKAVAKGNIWAVGDVVSGSTKTIWSVDPQVHVVRENIIQQIESIISGPPRYWWPRAFWHEPEHVNMIVTIGSKTGTGIVRGWRVWGMLVAITKGRAYLTEKTGFMVKGWTNNMGMPL